MRKLLVATLALLASTAAANATIVSGTYTAISSRNSTQIGNLLSTNFSLNLALGVAQSVNIFSLDSVLYGVSNIDANFNFSIPATGSTTMHGIDSFTDLGILSLDHLGWGSDAYKVVTLADGTWLGIGLADCNFLGLPGIYTGLIETVTFTLLQGPNPAAPVPPSAVPEPLTLSMFGAGLAAIAATGRRRRKTNKA